MKPETLIGLALLGVAAWALLRSSGALPTAAETRTQQLRAAIGALPPALTWQEQEKLKPDVSLASGAIQGASAGAVAGPWGIAIGAGAGAVASFFT